MTCPDCTPLIVCARCTQAKVNFIRMLEHEMGIEIRNKLEYQDALLSWNEKKATTAFNKKLRDARKGKGWSQKTMAAYLGVTKQRLNDMESGRRPLTKSNLRLINQLFSLGENA